MTEQEIQENNKLIVQFMGVNESMPHDHQGVYLYHKSWDWLLPVINKINSLDKTPKVGQECIIEELIDNIHTQLKLINLLDTYKAVVEFIKFWNNEKY